MSRKLVCNSCGYAELMSYQEIKYCPDCGSNNIVFETEPLAELRPIVEAKKDSEVKSEAKLEIKSEVDSEIVLKALPRPILKTSSRQRSQPSQRGFGYGTELSDSAKIRIVFGIIGLIMVIVALGMLSSGSLMTMLTLLVIGFIFLVIATKGEICT